MNINLVTISGRVISLEVNPQNTIKELKNIFSSKEEISEEQIRFMFNGVVLNDVFTLENYRITDNSNLSLVISLTGR